MGEIVDFYAIFRLFLRALYATKGERERESGRACLMQQNIKHG